MIEIVGMLAAILTTISFIPQVYKIYKSKSAEDVSMSMFLMFTVGLFLWLWYGIIIVSWPIILANTVTIILALAIIFLKIKYDREDQK